MGAHAELPRVRAQPSEAGTRRGHGVPRPGHHFNVRSGVSRRPRALLGRQGAEGSAETAEGVALFGDPNLALAPNRLPAHAGPAGGVQVGEKLRQIALVLRLASETAERMCLTG